MQTSYLWDPNAPLPQLAMERDGSGSLLRRHAYGEGPLSVYTGGSSRYFLPDGQGSVANVTSSTGTAQWTYTYEPFGTVRSATSGSGAATNVLKFDGQLVDTATGLYDLRARMYDPVIGRFLQRDPLERSLSSPLSASYAFVNDRPTVLVDPSGQAGEGGFWHNLWEDLQAGAPQVAWGGFIVKVLQCEAGGAQVATATAPLGAATGPGEVPTMIASFAVGCGASMFLPVEASVP